MNPASIAGHGQQLIGCFTGKFIVSGYEGKVLLTEGFLLGETCLTAAACGLVFVHHQVLPALRKSPKTPFTWTHVEQCYYKITDPSNTSMQLNHTCTYTSEWRG